MRRETKSITNVQLVEIFPGFLKDLEAICGSVFAKWKSIAHCSGQRKQQNNSPPSVDFIHDNSTFSTQS